MNLTTRLVFPLAALLMLPALAAARASNTADDWQPIAPEDLALKDNPKSPGADAMILYRESMIFAADSSVSEYVRIKIFTATGAKEGDVGIRYETSESQIRDIRARTIRPNGAVVNFEGTTYDKTVAKGQGFNYLEKTFSLPNVEPGSIIEYKYVEQFDRSHYISLAWSVQGALFMRLGRFSIKPAMQAGAPSLYFRQSNLPASSTPQRQPDGSYTLEVRDLPGLEEESYAAPDSTLRARVEFFYRGRMDPPNETVEQYWKRIGKSWSDELDEYANKRNALASEAGRVCSPADTAETKLRKLYARVQQIRNLSFEEDKSKKEEKQENLKPNANVEDVLKHGYGSRWQINAVFMGLVRATGLESTFVYVAPRDRTFFSPQVQDTRQLSGHVVWVRAGEKEYYLDPGARYFPFGLVPWRETGVMGVRVGKNNSEIVTTPIPAASEATLVRHAEMELDEDGVLTGKLQVEYEGLKAALKREEDRDEDDPGRRKNMEEEIKYWLPTGSTFDVTSMSNWDDVAAPIRVEGTVKIPGLTTSTGRRMLAPLTPFEPSQAKAFQPPKRVHDIYFHYPFEELDEVKLHVPAGYRIEILPPKRQMKPGVVFYEISATEGERVVEVKRRMTVDGVSIPVQYYPVLRTFFSSVKTNDEAQIVLQRSDAAKTN